MGYNYQTICHSNLLKDLPSRHKEVMVRRFGLRGEKETLESIGRSHDITRERVRQIEVDALKRLEERLNLPICQNVFQYFTDYFKKVGFLKKEDLLLADLGGKKFKNHIFFLLTLGSQTSLGRPFERYGETADFYSFWAIDKNAFYVAQRTINNFIGELEKKKEPLALPARVLSSYIEISKNILKGPQGLHGLRDWPEINPRGIKDKAYLIIKQEKRPLHFTDVAGLIGNGALVQTVHNELIKDPRFVLVGRGLYALREWGYEPGVVREVIARTVESAGEPLDKDGIIKEVLKQRQVQPNTILLNLQNKDYFIKNSDGKYTVRKI